MTKRYVTHTLVMTLCLIGSGCASQNTNSPEDIATLTNEKVEQFKENDEKALNDAEAAYQQAQQQELNLYAPQHMQKIQTELKNLRRADLQDDNKAIIASSAKILSLTETGLQNKEKVIQLLPQLTRQKTILNELKAQHIAPSEYQHGVEKFQQLIHLIDAKDDAEAVKKSAAVLAILHKVQLTTVLTTYWQPANETLKQAHNESADTQAPQTYQYAKQQVAHAERVIREHYDDVELAQQVGTAALRAAQHALFVSREVTMLANMPTAQAEQATLKFENYLAQLGRAINADDVRHMSLQDQALALKQFAEEHKDKLIKQYQKQIADLEEQLQKLTAQKQIATPLTNTLN